MKTSKRDLIIIGIILILSIGGFLFFNKIFKKSSGEPALIQHWYQGSNGFNTTEDLVIIDFEKRSVKKVNDQKNVPEEYGTFPIINLVDNTVTLLGEYVNPKTDKREILVIEFNFDNKSVEIITETSPRGICKNMGASVRQPLICIPNQIKVIFKTVNDGIDNEQ